ncbi:MAG: multiheme c-type cytochrome [Verrucomicrobiae bacterium]|nr:multiheme c-type cytochrome [Verrucomicrobiae bacterium]
MNFRTVFIAIVIATGLVVSAYLVNAKRPRVVVEQPSAAFITASGKCAECHRNNQYSIVHEYEMSKHAQKGVTCLDCHQAQPGQTSTNHNGFVITTGITPANCRVCHQAVYEQFAHSRHAAPSWVAVMGNQDFSPETIEQMEKLHPGSMKRPPHPLTLLEGGSATKSGCITCHAIGKPNSDGTIGNCTLCHTRHTSSVEVARLPSTCGQCHLGPDHSQIEIYTQSKHGIMFAAQKDLLNLKAPSDSLTTKDMFIPTCATCHMSGLNGRGVTHDPSERLSYNLFAEVTQPRPNAERAQAKMKDICLQCHTPPLVDRIYKEGAAVVDDTNEKVLAARAIMDGLKADGLLSTNPFSQTIQFTYFDLWHYYGRTAKHAAFMGGADYVQWHGNYPILQHMVELKEQAAQLRKENGK